MCAGERELSSELEGEDGCHHGSVLFLRFDLFLK